MWRGALIDRLLIVYSNLASVTWAAAFSCVWCGKPAPVVGYSFGVVSPVVLSLGSLPSGTLAFDEYGNRFCATAHKLKGQDAAKR